MTDAELSERESILTCTLCGVRVSDGVSAAIALLCSSPFSSLPSSEVPFLFISPHGHEVTTTFQSLHIHLPRNRTGGHTHTT